MSHSFEDLRQRIRESEEAGQREEAWRADCPKDEDFAAYVDGRLGAWRRLATWWHIRRCFICQVDLSVLRREAVMEEGKLQQPDQ